MVASPRPTGTARAKRRAAAEADNVFVDSLVTVVERLSDALLPTTEVVLHDLRKLPSSIVAVAGNVTDRTVGDPPTDVLLRYMASGSREDLLSYPTDLPGGRKLQSSTIIFRDQADAPLAALCVNNDVTHWLLLRQVAESALGSQHPLGGIADPTGVVLALAATTAQNGSSGAPGRTTPPNGEWFAHNIDELADHMITQAIDEVGVAVDLMKKEHKIRVVQQLRERGMFLIRDAIETVASSLEVSRFTIYNYLNELAAEEETTSANRKPSASGRSQRAPNRRSTG